MIDVTHKSINLLSSIVHPIKHIEDNDAHQKHTAPIKELSLKTKFLNDLKEIVNLASDRCFIYNKDAELIELAARNVSFNIIA